MNMSHQLIKDEMNYAVCQQYALLKSSRAVIFWASKNISKARRISDLNGFLVSKETVVLRRWGRSKQKFGFIKRVDKC